jgi:hypothetical protein
MRALTFGTFVVVTTISAGARAVDEGVDTNDAPLLPIAHSTAPKGMTAITAALGVQHVRSGTGVTWRGVDGVGLAGLFWMGHGISERWEWGLPLVLTYRGGRRGNIEWIPSIGLSEVGFGYSSMEKSILLGSIGVGAALRLWTGGQSSFDLGGAVTSPFRWSQQRICPVDEAPCPNWEGPELWTGRLSVGYSATLGGVVTVMPAIAVSATTLRDDSRLPVDLEFDPAVFIGAVNTRGFRPQPLFRVHFSDSASIDAYASAGYIFNREAYWQAYMLGGTWIW